MSNGAVPKFEDLVPVGAPPSADKLTTPPDSGFPAAAGRAARGFWEGLNEFTSQNAPYMPFMPGATAAGMEAKEMAARHPPKDPIESGFKTAAEIAPSFTPLPGGQGLGLARMAQGAIKGWPKLSRGLGTVTEGAVHGGIGGAMTPADEKDRASNIDLGAAIGAGTRGGGALMGSVLNAIPPQLKNSLSAIAAAAALNKMGMPWWVTSFAHLPPNGQPLFSQLYNANLLDLATKYLGKANRAATAPLAASGVKLKESAYADNPNK